MHLKMTHLKNVCYSELPRYLTAKSNDMNDDYHFLQWNNLQSGKNVAVFQRKLLLPSPTLMKEAAGYSYTPVNFYHITLRHTPENNILQSLL
jgi:hypothetical protein